MSLLDVIVEFAATGRLGPLSAGMPAGEAWAALRRPAEPAGDGNYRIDSLDFAVRDGAVYVLGLEHEGDLTFRLPVPLDPQPSARAGVAHDELIAALTARGLRTEPVLTTPDGATMLRAGKVHLTFLPSSRGRRLLSNVGRSADM